MSMTREEAIELVCYGDWLNILMLHLGDDDINRLAEAMCIIGNTLRPVSREQVEKVFGGKWEEETYTTVSGRGRVIHSKKYTCSVCGKANGRAKTNFCPHCGASQTDEAVEMVMERLEALNDV